MKQEKQDQSEEERKALIDKINETTLGVPPTPEEDARTLKLERHLRRELRKRGIKVPKKLFTQH